MAHPSEQDILREGVANAWTVLRHGGRSTDSWKRKHTKFSHVKASGLFDKEKDRMRQGGLSLIAPNGEIERHYEAPRVRSRW